jgi:hypothetical protein
LKTPPRRLAASPSSRGPGSTRTMLLFRWAMLFLLLAAGVCFAFYVGTGQQRFRHWGLRILKWTVLAALGFFGVLILERIA